MTKRYLSLDILRGLTVALMIVVNNPGSWSNVFPFLRHAHWEGCTLCDMVFPTFLFCVGVSMAFALSKFTSLTGGSLKKILKRGLLLFLVGLGLNAFPFYPSQSAMNPDLSFWQNWLEWLGRLRIMGVLQRIALCYVLASVLVLWLQNLRKIIVAGAGLAILYTILMLAFAGPEGAFSLAGNIAGKVDIFFLGENHVYRGYGIPFDPEGLLGVLTGTCTVLIGYLIGQTIRNTESKTKVAADIYTYSLMSLLLGLVLSIWMPISKPLWTVSYVFYAGGWSMMALAFLVYLVDVKGCEKPFFPFKALGMNALALYVLSGILAITMRRYIGWDHTLVFGANGYTSLLYSLLYMSVHLVIAVILYKKKIFIKL